MKVTHKNFGTCSREVSYDIDENGIVTNITFVGGCNGNLKGIGALCNGMKASEIAERLRGIKCGFKQTSCPDQLAHSLDEQTGTKGEE